jgi:hypothetical protein
MEGQRDLAAETSHLRRALTTHPLHQRLVSLEQLHVFLEHHVFAVWDFMSLLKSLQRRLTCTDVPWRPKGDPKLRGLLNELVLGEESDPVVGGKSHFEWYLDGMRQAGANTGPVLAFLDALGEGAPIEVALQQAPPAARPFVRRTLDIAQRAPDVVVAAEFTSGREGLLPAVFSRLIAELAGCHPGKLEIFLAYLERHVEVDGESHGPLAEEMVASLARTDDDRVLAAHAAVEALLARKALWDGILAELDARQAAWPLALAPELLAMAMADVPAQPAAPAAC